MPNLTIQLTDRRTAFAPREKITGKVSWQLEKPPQSGEVRLVWSTSGRGIVDVGIAGTFPFPNPQATETRSFTITSPDGPYSFSGTLITLTWTLEAVLQPRDVSEGLEIVIAPGGKAISLPAINPA